VCVCVCVCVCEQPRAHPQPTGATTQGDFAEDDAEASGDFASLDEFAHILDGAGGEEVSAKQKEWEARTKKNKKGAKGAFFASAHTTSRTLLTHTRTQHNPGKKKAASDEDEGDIFDMDDSASGEEEDEGDFNFASKYVISCYTPSFLYDGTH